MSSSNYVICINDNGCINITKDRVYELIGKGKMSSLYKIIDNNGMMSNYYKGRFRSIIPNKINKLLYKGS